MSRPGCHGARRVAGASLTALYLLGACAVNLSESLDGHPCKGDLCLPGYECVEQICVRKSGASGGSASSSDSGSPGEAGRTVDGGSSHGTGGTRGAIRDAAADAFPTVFGTKDATPDSGAPNAGVRCDHERCAGSQVCCLARYPAYPEMPAESDFSCQERGADCAYTLACDGTEDCAPGEVCCATETDGKWVAECATSCGGSAVKWGCTTPMQCPPELVCCGTFNEGLQRVTRTDCAATCSGANQRLFCDSKDARSTCTGGMECGSSALAPGFEACDSTQQP